MERRIEINKNKIVSFVLFFYIIIFFFVLGCSNKSIKDNQNYIIGINNIKTLNPFLMTNRDEKTISNLIYASLFSMNEKMDKFVPYIGKKFKITDNQIIVEIDDNFLDSNKNIIDADYLKKYYSYFQKKDNTDESSFIPDIKNLIIETEGNNLIIRFDEKLSPIERIKKVGHLFTFPVLSPQIFQNFQNKEQFYYQYANFDNYFLPVVSTGIWKIKELNSDLIILEKKDLTKTKNIFLTFNIIRDYDAILQKLINKEIDLCFGDYKDKEFLKNFYTIKSIDIEDPDSFYVLLFNFQSSILENKKQLNNINFRKRIYNLLYNYFKSDKYITASHKNEKLSSIFNKNDDQFLNYSFNLFAISDDPYAIILMQKINDIFNQEKINVNCYNENLNSMIARIYATKNWDFFITSLAIDYPFLIEFEFFNPFSFQHICNINLDNNIDLLNSFESHIYQELEQNYLLILKYPGKIYEIIEKNIIKYYYFVPLSQNKINIFYNRKIRLDKARIINKGFYLNKIFD